MVQVSCFFLAKDDLVCHSIKIIVVLMPKMHIVLLHRPFVHLLAIGGIIIFGSGGYHWKSIILYGYVWKIVPLPGISC